MIAKELPSKQLTTTHKRIYLGLRHFFWNLKIVRTRFS